MIHWVLNGDPLLSTTSPKPTNLGITGQIFDVPAQDSSCANKPTLNRMGLVNKAFTLGPVASFHVSELETKLDANGPQVTLNLAS